MPLRRSSNASTFCLSSELPKASEKSSTAAIEQPPLGAGDNNMLNLRGMTAMEAQSNKLRCRGKRPGKAAGEPAASLLLECFRSSVIKDHAGPDLPAPRGMAVAIELQGRHVIGGA